MDLEISKDITKDKAPNTDVSDFLKELEKEMNKTQSKEITVKDIKINENSNLNLVNNIAKSNKMTNENREELFLQERLSLFDIRDSDKRVGELYYLASNGVDNDFYTFRVNSDLRDERFQMVKKTELPENAKLGEIYRKKKGIFSFSKEETKEHEERMKLAAVEILNKQEVEGGYKREYTKNDLILGKGYEAEYFEYPLDIYEELGREAGLPLTMIDNILKDDIGQVYANVLEKLSEGDNIYTVLPYGPTTLYEFSDGKMKKSNLGEGLRLWDMDGVILKTNKAGELVKDSKMTKEYHQDVINELKSTVKTKYDKICEDYKKEKHIYRVNKALDEDFVPTITLEDISENRFLELEDLDFIQNTFAGEGIYVVKDDKYYKIDAKKEIPKNNTIDRDKEDERNFANIIAKKYNISKEEIEDKMKEFMVEASKEEGVVVYTGYDKQKDEYYMEYYMEGDFDEREIISKKDAENMNVGTFSTMGRDEFDNYSGYFDAAELQEEFEEKIKNSIKNNKTTN